MPVHVATARRGSGGALAAWTGSPGSDARRGAPRHGQFLEQPREAANGSGQVCGGGGAVAASTGGRGSDARRGSPESAPFRGLHRLLLYRMGEYAEAEALLRRAQAGRSATLGEKHTDTRTYAHILASVLIRRRKLCSFLKVYKVITCNYFSSPMFFHSGYRLIIRRGLITFSNFLDVCSISFIFFINFSSVFSAFVGFHIIHTTATEITRLSDFFLSFL